MYTQSDSDTNNQRIKKTATVLIAIFVVGIAAVVPTVMYRIEWATDLVSCLFGAAIIFIWNLKLTPLLYYRKFLRELGNGMTHEMVAEFVGISPDISTHEGVDTHVFEMSEGPKEKGDDLRTFYWDASKPLPEINAGEMLRVTSHGGFVIGWQRV